jgi:hypothetical protein
MSDEIEVEVELDEEIEVEVDFPDVVYNASGGVGNVNIKNTDSSFDVTASTSPYILEDTTINVYVNGVLNTTVVRPSMVERTINITA